ncbi:MAG TPA: hypothetical protein VJV03_19520 [Pyrinomonadaceae bacterium]|nr:hypothetical protein [Pyrinomonadaceae bacterium]
MGQGYEGNKQSTRSRVPHTFSVTASAYVPFDQVPASWYDPREKSALAGAGAVGLTLSVVAVFWGLAYVAPKLSHLFSQLQLWVPSPFDRAQIGAIASLVVGIGLFELRNRKRKLYASLEIAFGIILGGVGINRASEGELVVWLAMGSAAYIIVRGLDNLRNAGFTFAGTWNAILQGPLVTAANAAPPATDERDEPPATQPPIS